MSDLTPDTPTSAAETKVHATQPFNWSVRRELWENRATYIAPASVAGLLLIGALLGTVRFAGVHNGQTVLDAPPIARLGLLEAPYAIAAIAVAATALIVAILYSLGALYNDRRDRSLLFWKSLPVSDLTTVLAKAFVPMVVMPVATFLIIEVMEWVMVGLNTLSLLLHSKDVAQLWDGLPFLQMQAVILYTLVVTTLWFAPLYAWFLFISAWAKRVPFLWAFLPPIVLALVEHIAFGSRYVHDLIAYRLDGFKDAYSDQAGQVGVIVNPATLINPLSLIGLPGLWLGLVATAGLLAAAIWFRRRREPI